MGTIRERDWKGGKAWQLRYTDADGKRRSEQFQYKHDAEARERDIVVELHGGIHTPRGGSLKIKDLVPLWLSHKDKLDRSKSTVDQYRTHAHRHILPQIGEMRLSDLKPPRVRTFFDDLVIELSPTMAKYVARSFRNLIKYAVGKGYIARDPAADLRLEFPSAQYDEAVEDTDDKAILVPSSDTIGRIIGQATLELAAEIGLSALAGLRSEETRALMWKDIDFGAGKVRVRRAANRANQLITTKTAAGRRSVPMSRPLHCLLNDWKELIEREKEAVKPDTLIFPDEAGKVKSYERLTRIEFYRLLERLGMQIFGWHQLRDFFATTMVAAGIRKEQLKVWMGHTDYGTTQKYYVHPVPLDDDRAFMSSAQSGVKISRPSDSSRKNDPTYPQLVTGHQLEVNDDTVSQCLRKSRRSLKHR